MLLSPTPGHQPPASSTSALSAHDFGAVLTEVFALAVEAEWVWDFLFKTTPAAEAQMLNSPYQLGFSCVGDILCSVAEESDAHGHAFDSETHARRFLMPVMNVGPLAAGIGVQEVIGTNNDASVEGLRFEVMRVVRNVETGTMLSISENPSVGLTSVEFLVHRSTVCRTRAFLRFDVNMFRAAVQSGRTNSLAQKLASALRFSEFDNEYRNCPLCCAPWDAKCSCAFAFLRPSHPLDFSGEAMNMASHVGPFSGSTTIRLFGIDGINTESLICTSASSATVCSDSSATMLLVSRAMQDRLSLVPSYPSNVSGLVAADSHPQNSFLGCLAEAEQAEKPEPEDEFLSQCLSLSELLPVVELLDIDADAPRYPEETWGADHVDAEGLSTGSSGTGSPDGTGAEIDERKRRELIRREKNRESARRSNLKRKEHNARLRRDLANARKQSDTLLTRERCLRKENRRLRQLAACPIGGGMS